MLTFLTNPISCNIYITLFLQLQFAEKCKIIQKNTAFWKKISHVGIIIIVPWVIPDIYSCKSICSLKMAKSPRIFTHSAYTSGSSKNVDMWTLLTCEKSIVSKNKVFYPNDNKNLCAIFKRPFQNTFCLDYSKTVAMSGFSELSVMNIYISNIINPYNNSFNCP